MEAPNVLSDTGYGTSFLDGRKSWKMAELETGFVGDFLLIDDLLDFSNEEIAGPIGENCEDIPNNNVNADSSTITAITMTETVLSCNNNPLLENRKSSHISNTDEVHNIPPGDLCVSCDDLAELEWLSNFVEDSFSTGDVAKEISVLEGNSCSEKPLYTSEILPVPGRARSKRSRAPVCNWVSRILSPSSSANVLENGSISSLSGNASFSSDSDVLVSEQGGADSGIVNKFVKTNQGIKKKMQVDHYLQARKCTHCGTQKTPQWRAGPNGPKTLCNACGVRFKSGRLLPEYRPAASPTFIVSKHSNSHRKVLEMRRQKDEQPLEELVQELKQKCCEDQSYFSRSDDECLLHNNNNTREDNFCRHLV